MCGIAGWFDAKGRGEVSRSLLARMNRSMVHRGPDEDGLHLEPGLGLVHRRLSIIDLSTGRQPLYNEDGSVAVVFNGEIYNFQELVKEDRKSTRLNSSHVEISYAVFCLKKKKEERGENAER